jgi:hypothetical protein
MAKKDQHVIPRADGKWSVRSSGAERASRVFPTKSGAISYARTSLRLQRSGQVYVHAQDGAIRSREAYGKDPFSPRG